MDTEERRYNKNSKMEKPLFRWAGTPYAVAANCRSTYGRIPPLR
jgi:hypothetical protein